MPKRGHSTGAKMTRYRVTCTLCNETFDHDYTEKHTQRWHRDIVESGRNAPTVPIGMAVAKDPWTAAAASASTKKSRVDIDEDSGQSRETHTCASTASEENTMLTSRPPPSESIQMRTENRDSVEILTNLPTSLHGSTSAANSKNQLENLDESSSTYEEEDMSASESETDDDPAGLSRNFYEKAEPSHFPGK